MRLSVSFAAIICLLATSACGSTSTEDKPTTDAGKDAATGIPPVAVSELPGKAFVFVGMQSDMALMMRGGETQTLVTVRAAGESLGGLESAWLWQAGSSTANASDPCAPRDGDGVPASPGTSSGQIDLSGETSTSPPDATASWGKAAASTKAALLGGQSLDANNIITQAGLVVGMQASLQVECAYPPSEPSAASGAFDGAALVGTQSDVNGWWFALSSVIPAP